MQISWHIFVPVLLLSLSGAVAAAVYESKDAQGNAVFSDTTSPGSARIDIGTTNVVGGVKVEDHPQPTAESSEPSGHKNVTWESQVDSDVRRDQWRERELNGEVAGSPYRHEVGDNGNESRHDVGDDDLHRHEVGDDLVEHSHDDGDDYHHHQVDGNAGEAVGQRHIRRHFRR
jgi:hypothetical protein